MANGTLWPDDDTMPRTGARSEDPVEHRDAADLLRGLAFATQPTPLSTGQHDHVVHEGPVP